VYDGVFLPVPVKRVYRKPFEQFPPSFKQFDESGTEEALPKTPRTSQEYVFAGAGNKIVYTSGLIHINAAILDNFREGLYTKR
jgi:hypothetical protein